MRREPRFPCGPQFVTTHDNAGFVSRKSCISRATRARICIIACDRAAYVRVCARPCVRCTGYALTRRPGERGTDVPNRLPPTSCEHATQITMPRFICKGCLSHTNHSRVELPVNPKEPFPQYLFRTLHNTPTVATVGPYQHDTCNETSSNCHPARTTTRPTYNMHCVLLARLQTQHCVGVGLCVRRTRPLPHGSHVANNTRRARPLENAYVDVMRCDASTTAFFADRPHVYTRLLLRRAAHTSDTHVDCHLAIMQAS